MQKNEGFLKRIDTFLIYSNLVSEQYTGDSFSNLLRMCPVHGKDNQRVVERFEKIHYVPIAKRYITNIDIHIKTVEDIFVTLKDLTYIKLHFRKIRD